MLEINFGVPKKRKKKEEFREDVPALRIEAYRGQNTSRRILINSLAMDQMGIIPGNNVTIGFDSNANGYITICNDDHPHAYKINKIKPYLFADAKMYKYIVDTYFEGDDSVDHDIVLLKDAVEPGIYKLDFTCDSDSSSVEEVVKKELPEAKDDQERLSEISKVPEAEENIESALENVENNQYNGESDVSKFESLL